MEHPRAREEWHASGHTAKLDLESTVLSPPRLPGSPRVRGKRDQCPHELSDLNHQDQHQVKPGMARALWLGVPGAGAAVDDGR